MSQLGGSVGRQKNADDIEAVRVISKREEPSVEAGSANDAEAFPLVDGGLRTGELVVPPSLDFQKDEERRGEGQVVGDEVDLALDGASVPSAADGTAKVARDNLIALGGEIAGGDLFPKLAQLTGGVVGGERTARRFPGRSNQPSPVSPAEEVYLRKVVTSQPESMDGEKSPSPVRTVRIACVDQGPLRSFSGLIQGVEGWRGGGMR
jgi:hypothetical protein